MLPARQAADVGPCLPHDHGQLDLPVDLVAHRGVDRYVAERLHERRDRFGEDGRRARLAPFLSRLGRVLLVVPADRDHVAARLRQRRQQLDVVDRVLVSAALGGRFARLIQPTFSGIDQRKHVARLGKLDYVRAVGVDDTEPRPAAMTKSHKPHLP